MTTFFKDKAVAAADTVFQGMCYVALSMVAQDVLNNVNSTAKQKSWARRALTGATNASAQRVAEMCLRNSVVGNLPTGGVNSQDAAMITAVLEQLDNLVELG